MCNMYDVHVHVHAYVLTCIHSNAYLLNREHPTSVHYPCMVIKVKKRKSIHVYMYVHVVFGSFNKKLYSTYSVRV